MLDFFDSLKGPPPREGLLLHSGSVITHQLLERLVQTGGGQAADHAGQDGAGVDGGPAGPAWCR